MLTMSDTTGAAVTSGWATEMEALELSIQQAKGSARSSLERIPNHFSLSRAEIACLPTFLNILGSLSSTVRSALLLQVGGWDWYWQIIRWRWMSLTKGFSWDAGCRPG